MFDEDTAANLRICLEMAPQHCDACGDFHISVAVRRSQAEQAAPRTVGMDFDRGHYISLLREAMRHRIDNGLPLSVLIAGAADTAIYHLVLEAAVVEGGEELARRLDMHVVDLCETPLEMCRQFATRHGLKVETSRADIGDFAPGRTFGLIAMHGVLPFFPAPRRLEYLQRIGGWLDGQGRLVSAIQINEHAPAAESEAQTEKRLRLLDAYVKEHPEAKELDVEDLQRRIRRAIVIRRSYPQLFADNEALVAFHRAAGLEIAEERMIEISGDLAKRRYKQRAVVLCQPAQG